MTELSRDDIAHLGMLARLELTEEESSRYATQLTSIVGYVEQLQSVNTDHVDAMLGVTGMRNIIQEDETRPANSLGNLEPLDVISQAPQSEGRFIEVKAVLGDETGAA